MEHDRSMPALEAAAAGVLADHEAGSEDHRDDEHDSCDDADPRGHLVEPALPVRRGGVRSAGGGGGGGGVVVATGLVAGSEDDVGSLITQIMQTVLMRFS